MQGIISFSNRIDKIVRNLVNLLKTIGMYSSKLNSGWLLISLTIMNSEECKDFFKILLKIMRKTIH